MTVTAPEQSQVPAARGTAIDPSDRKAARIAGALFILTFVTAIAARVLFDPVRNDVGYIVGAGADTRVFLGATMELLLIITNIGTAVVLFRILRRQNETLALGYLLVWGFRATSPVLLRTSPAR
jgi:uncharacterized protein DUF4386